MSRYFCDTSALVKRYVTETGSMWLTATIDPKANNYVFIVRITYVEIISAISRKERVGDISIVDAAAAKKQFEIDYLGTLIKVEANEALILEAGRLAEKHALRGYDAVQLAAALQTQQKHRNVGLPLLTLLSADLDLNAAAVSEGMTVDNPNDH